MNRSDRKMVLLAAAVFFIAAGVYLPTLNNTFIWDDLQLVTNPLTIKGNPYAFLFGGGAYFRPFLHLSMATDFSLWHLNSSGYHITNILLHAINSLLVFLAGFLLMRNQNYVAGDEGPTNKSPDQRIALPFVSAAIFALHPVHTESVAWISGRTDMLATLFFLLAFISYLEYAKGKNAKGLVLSCLFFLFSLFSKENAIAFVVVVFAYGIITKMPWKRIALSQTSLLAVIIIYFLFRQTVVIKMISASPGSANAFFSSGISHNNFLPFLAGSSGYYFEKLVLPFNLNIMPEIPHNPIYFLIALLPFVLGGFFYFSRRRLEVFMLIWIIATLLPSLSIVFSQIAAPLGERYLYLPSAGFAILSGLILARIKNYKVFWIIVLSVFVVFAVLTFERLKVWENDIVLWEDTVRKNPTSIAAHINYGRALLEGKEQEKAKRELLIALGQKKIMREQASTILYLLGTAEMTGNNYEKAEAFFKDAIKTNTRNAFAYNNLGILYLRMSDRSPGGDNKVLDDAISNLKEALILSPNLVQAKFNIGLCYLKQRDFDNAERSFYSVIESDPAGNMSNDAQQLLFLIEFQRQNLGKSG
jgi:protein O-mannosyl-transferase